MTINQICLYQQILSPYLLYELNKLKIIKIKFKYLMTINESSIAH